MMLPLNSFSKWLDQEELFDYLQVSFKPLKYSTVHYKIFVIPKYTL